MSATRTLKAHGDAGATWAIEHDGELFNLLLGSVVQWSALPPSRIRSFLMRKFSSLDALAEAVAVEDVTTMLMSQDRMGQVLWRLDDDGYALVETNTAHDKYKINLQIRLPHSTSI